MLTRHIDIQFQTPAFLGDATQSGRWRTAPFKAQWRQWWRVAFAAQQQFAVNVREMRDIEGHLFGHAWLDSDRDQGNNKVAARQSKVRIRLNRWDQGKETSWPGQDSPVQHPNVHDRDGRLKPVGSQLYMGFGPLVFDRGTALKKGLAAIQAKEHAQLAVAFPDEHAALLEHALQLMNLYGTVGGRSRNGWGSYSLHSTSHLVTTGVKPCTQPLAKCLSLDWPHALGTDDHGVLVWQTQPHKDWASLMKTLANIKIALRTQFVFTGGRTHNPEARHWLSYPVTNHVVTSWGNNARLPNSLRFKVRPTADGQLVGVVFHMPHKPPAEFGSTPQILDRVWRQVHNHLDQTPGLHRIAA
jgi:CRISPR-associated protein Cmr1